MEQKLKEGDSVKLVARWKMIAGEIDATRRLPESKIFGCGDSDEFINTLDVLPDEMEELEFMIMDIDSDGDFSVYNENLSDYEESVLFYSECFELA